MVNMRSRTSLVVVLLLLGPGGCVEVDGGALEVRWDIRDEDVGRINCDIARQRVGLASLRLSAVPLTDTPSSADGGSSSDGSAGANDLCAVDDRCTFACDTAGDDVLLGITPFFLPGGRYLIRSVGLDGDGSALTSARGLVTPAAVVRQVNSGEVTDLNVNLIVVQSPSGT